MTGSHDHWDPAQLPDLHGRVYVVTGGNAGLGFFTADQLAHAGARVVIACRDPQRARTALAVLRSRTPIAHVESIPLDTTDPDSADAAARSVLDLPRLDGLILNAGITQPPKRRQHTTSGNELVLATNVLGHVRLAAKTLPLVAESGGRIVSLGSLATRLATLDPDDLQFRRGYRPFRAYARSKIALEMFAFELDRRLRSAGSSAASLVAQPGYAIGGIGPRIDDIAEPSFAARVAEGATKLVAQSKDHGAWPTVRAAVDPNAVGGQYYGPSGRTRGRPRLQKPAAAVMDTERGALVFRRLEDLAGAEIEL